jgi:RimJ/RimL family protein N-acetyltransferase
MFIVVQDELYLTEVRETDRAALLEHLQAREIHDQTLTVPYPYTEADADRFLKIVHETEQQQGRPVIWAIRDADDRLLGVLGFKGLVDGHGYLAEVGYWLAKPYWGRGIMTAVLRTACACAFLDFGLGKITAHVFPSNPASARVLEKCGFKLEGYLRKHCPKGEQVIDAKAYGLLREEARLGAAK